MKVSKVLRFSLVFYFLIPYLIFISFFDSHFNLNLQELLWAFKNSFVQSFSAAVLVTFLSVPLSLGLFQFEGRFYVVIKKLLLLPQVLPSFFSILIAFSIWNPFPLGSLGIAFIFTMVHLGFAVVLVHAATQEKLGPYGVVGQVFGVTRFQFFKNIYLPLMKVDLSTCFFLIFIFCFSSFAIPLMAGGGKDTNVEVLIFEKIFINQNWSTAWVISLVQSLFLTGISLLLLGKKNINKREFLSSKYLRSSFGFFVIVIYLFVFLAGYGLGLLRSLPDFSKLSLFYQDILTASLNSLELLTLYILVSVILLYAWLYDFVQSGRLSFSRHFIAASTMLVGFCFYLYFPQTSSWDYLKIPFAMSILVFPVLFKSFLEKPLLDLHDQVITAKVFGISNHQIVIHVILRRLQAPLLVWFSFLSVWFLCDFAISRALGVQTPTLGLMAQTFLSSYRLSMAYLLSFYILILWILVLAFSFFLKGVLGVGYQKFKFKF